MIKYREYSDISRLVIENSVLKKKNREQKEENKQLKQQFAEKEEVIKMLKGNIDMLLGNS